ncbi:MAG TPA: S8 family serine peptidase, partial [Chitinophagaceae bacterium]|nr:S8 family serine peptidase [Chitinophagaceae bacterium]
MFDPRPAPAGFPDSVTAHAFNNSGDIYQQLRLAPGSYTIVLQWDDDIYSIGQTATGTLTDLDIYLLDLGGNLICGYNRVSTFGDPVEVLAFTVTNSVPYADANLLITKANRGPIPRFKYVIFRGNPLSIEYQTGATTIVGQANAKGAIAVGAVNYFNTPALGGTLAIAPYSSIGGTSVRTNILEARNKPDVAAPDGVNTSVNMGGDIAVDSDPFSNFFGTSAAAPHAAAVAALMINGKKRYAHETLIPDSVKAIMQRTAIPFGASNAAGAGLIQASIALQQIAMPLPALISLEYPSTITPTNLPTENFTLTIHGSYLTNTTEVIFRDSTLETTFINDSTLIATLPPFTGNPPIKVYTPPIANGDGGYSNTIYFFSIPKLTVILKADDKTKKYGEQLPTFTSTISVFNPQTGATVPLSESGLTQDEVGLQILTYETNANALSNVGSQYFIKPIRRFDSTRTEDIALLERFVYDTLPGILTIQKLPVKVVPEDQTITYGEDLQPITFRYEIDTAIATANPEVVNIIRLSHQEFLLPDTIGLVNRLPVAISNGALPVAISNGFPIAISNNLPVAISNGEEIPLYNAQSVTGFDVGLATVTPYTFTQNDLANLSFYVSEKSLATTRQLTANTSVIDIAQESILGYNSDPSLTYMVNTVEPTKAKGILGAEPLSNGSLPIAISNRSLPVAISNAFPIAISNGAFPIAISNSLPIAISNGAFPIAISNSFSEQAHRIAVIIDQNDVSNQDGIVIRALNVVTGLTSGEQAIIPGSVLNDNY